jgi:hypothetical protein
MWLPTFWLKRVFLLSRAEQSDNASSFLEDRSPQPLALWSAVAAMFATVNEIVKVYVLHLTSVCCALNRHIFQQKLL